MRVIFLLLFLLFSLSAAGQDQDSGMQDRIREIETWSSAAGTWEGRYFVRSAPEALLQVMEEDGSIDSGIGVRVILGSDEATVYLQYEPDGEWSTVAPESQVISDKIAWHILLSDEGGVWLERFFLSFMRIEEEEADFVITRTVHNWYDTGAPDIPTTYHVFGAGKVSRVKDVE